MKINCTKSKKAFSLIELSIVVLIIGLIVAGVIGAKKLVTLSNLSKARALTNSSPVNGIEDLVLWLETTSKNSFLASEGTDGVAISQWNNISAQSNNKNNALQATPINQPTYMENGINGLPILKFDGTSDYFTVVDNGSLSLTAWTIFLVYGINVDKTNGIIVKGADASENYEVSTYITKNITFPILFTDSARGTSNVLSFYNIGENLIFTYRFSSSLGAQIYKNGSASAIDPNGSAYTKTPKVNINDVLYIGSDTLLSGRYLNGYIGEIIIYNRALSDFEKEQIEQYLSKKWGIKLT